MKEEPNQVEEAVGEGTMHEPSRAPPEAYPQMPGCPTDPPPAVDAVPEDPPA